MATKKSNNPLTAMAAGCIAGGVEATSVWPMEYIKTQLQLKSKGSKLPYTGMISGLKYTIETTGFFSLYRGLAPTLIGSIPKAGIRFGLNSVIKEKLRDKDGKLGAGKNFVAGLGAGVSEALLIVAPVETVKTKVIEMNMPFLEGLKHIIKTEGFGGVYQGAFATALKQGSNQGLRFMWFNEYKNRVTNEGEIPLTPIMGLFGGMSAGCFSTLGNNPFDVVKTRMQGTNASQYKGTLDCFQQIISKEGFGAFYAGVVPRLGRVVPGQGIIFMSFESIQSWLEGRFDIFKS
ncbi:mitochondrial carrier [Fragilariopsis cylindrus CCMP1102]|uniref:Mitochondrial carrier n=1 Tax=Fragilariopsis cylindrus CCMP1102 TaxID=635003 RepID=A0A1E7EPB3_9STRA|nr:mitochondrial carrier [Fragilariopsis cylindrus CCMP1102]|eukprot:OEU07818.1 mitochondrial carrier [Fragilariopsis cylindrus CCMP1102]